MTVVRRLGAMALVIALAGCSYVPERTPSMGMGTSAQTYWQSVTHWQALANHIAGEIVVTTGKGEGIYIERLDDRSPFGGAFRESLITAFDRVGVNVLHRREKGAMRMHYSVRPIRHSDTDYWPPKGTLTAMALAATTVYYLGETILWPSIVASALFTEMFEVPWPEIVDGPMSEVQINYTLMDGERMVLRKTNTYYVDSQEIHQYAGALPATPRVVKTGGYSTRPPSTRSIAVRPEKF